MRRIKGKFNIEEKTNPKKRDLWFLYSQVIGDAGTAITYVLDAENPESVDFNEMHAPLGFTETTLAGDVPEEDAHGAGDVMAFGHVYIGKVEYWDNWKVTLKCAIEIALAGLVLMGCSYFGWQIHPKTCSKQSNSDMISLSSQTVFFINP